MKSKKITRTKNNEKNNNTLRVTRVNCQTRITTINRTRKIAHNGIDIDRNSIATSYKNNLISFKHLENHRIIVVERIKKSNIMRTTDHNDEKLSYTECCTMLRNGRAEWSLKHPTPNIQKL